MKLRKTPKEMVVVVTLLHMVFLMSEIKCWSNISDFRTCNESDYYIRIKWRKLETHMITDEEKKLVAPRIDTLGNCQTDEACAIIYAVLRICKHVTK